jgi:hypothetical protein
MVVQRVCPEMTFLFFFFSFSFFLGLRTGHAKNHTGPSIYFFFGFSPFSLICKFFLFTLIISIRFYFLFHPCSFYFWNLFLNLALILLITICFVLIIFLIHLFFYNSTPRHLFSFNFCVKFGHASYNCYFLIFFLMDCIFTISFLNI